MRGHIRDVAQKCINCGAPLHGCQCEYCGTVYSNEPFSGSVNDSYTGTITVNGETIRCYISEIEHTYVGDNFYRTIDGKLKRDTFKKYRKITLMEI